ncbi:MAG: DUF1007 family protein, partial [Spirochaetales bacterium]|nr:DUF1007 family protein [Spirochaetales bacterium]
MKKIIFPFLLNAFILFSHPHVFIDINMEIGDLSKAKIEWTFDLIESQNKIYYFDDDGDGLLNENEIDNFYNEGFKSVRDFNYFITLKIGDKSYPVQEI